MVLQLTLFYIFSLSISFFVFNLIPVFPLDGFRIYDALAKRRGGFYRFLRFQGIYVLYFLLFLSVIADFTGLWQLNILGIALNFVAGYNYKNGSPVEVKIGTTTINDIFTEGDKAWTLNGTIDKELVDAMKRGQRMIVKGVSDKGTATKDTYSLNGFMSAYRAINAKCKR